MRNCLHHVKQASYWHIMHCFPATCSFSSLPNRCLPPPEPGDTLHLVHIIPCLPTGDLATFFQPIDSDTGFLMEYPDPSLLGTRVPKEVVEREAQACKAEKV